MGFLLVRKLHDDFIDQIKKHISELKILNYCNRYQIQVF